MNATAFQEFFKIHNILNIQVIDRRSFFQRKVIDITGRYAAFRCREPNVEKSDLIIEIGHFTPNLQGCSVLDGEYYIKPNYFFHKEEHYKLGGFLTFDVEGLEEDICRVRVDANFTGMPFVAGLVIDFFIHYCITIRGYSLLHASGLSKDQYGVVFSGRGGGGKTTLALAGVTKGNYEYLGDNFIICYNGEIYSFISDLNMFGYNLIPNVWNKFTMKEKIMFRMKEWLYKITLSYIKIFTAVSPNRIFTQRIRSNSKLRKFFLLLAGPEYQVETADRREIIQRTISNMKLEFFNFVRHIEAYACLLPASTFAEHWVNYAMSLEKNLPENIEYFLLTMPLTVRSQEIDQTLGKAFSEENISCIEGKVK